MPHSLTISVRELIEFSLRKGDLSTGQFAGKNRLQEAIRAHQKIQKSRPEPYQAEVTVQKSVLIEDLEITIKGRIDGLTCENDEWLVEEIKTTTGEFPEEAELHWAQAKIYAYIILCEKEISEITVQLTYYQLDTKEIEERKQLFKKDDLNEFFDQVLQIYATWAKQIISHQQARNKALQKLDFPFSVYRKGQRELAKAVFRTIRDEKQLLIQAPTGIGKTMAVLFPACKALTEKQIDKIFYFTARSTGKKAAETALNLLSKSLCKSVTLTAKEKICFLNEVNCENCLYAKKYFDKLPNARQAIFPESLITREVVERYARQFELCPFEFSLEIALWSDVVIGDYHYGFDPKAKLKRFFGEQAFAKGNFAFLVDEAHQLVDRAREMFSAELDKKDFLNVKKFLQKREPNIKKAAQTNNQMFLEKRKEMATDKMAETGLPENLLQELFQFCYVTETWLGLNQESDFRALLLETYFKVLDFLRVSEQIDENYRILYRRNEADLKVRLFCLHPAKQLTEVWKTAKSVLFLSATLTPFSYFQTIFGVEEYCETLQFASPFPAENLKILFMPNISTRYKHREATSQSVSSALRKFVSVKKGNYLLFFPSYAYLNAIKTELETETWTLVEQKSSFSEMEREHFLQQFDMVSEDLLVGMAVMGGVFGEAIDLVGDKLQAVAILGVGLPGLSFERDLLRDYYEEYLKKGFEFAYQIPGMIRVLQAAGRVIRSETDKGAILLIDDRFLQQNYKKLLPNHWKLDICRNEKQIEKHLQGFWNAKI
jgi:DNA excision repair protein ERCC-2